MNYELGADRRAVRKFYYLVCYVVGVFMNIKEFAALKVGDKIENPAFASGRRGAVVECSSSGVRVVWGPRHDRETKFFYSVIGTSWMQWSKVT